MCLGTPTTLRFLSTPSARRATIVDVGCDKEVFISIHALREEGDRAGADADHDD